MTNLPVHVNAPLTNILKTDTSSNLLQFWRKNFLIELLDAMSNNNGQGFFTTTMNKLEVLFPDLFVDKNT